ncbi:MAG: hypothetical protein NWE89_16860 [Candidatus Bathyarchaeota archaeon]|nr:hypothetical protein [Candidatus Bathyarchaeota archaeon]
MNQSFDEKELEREMFLDSTQDGLMELLLGVSMMGVAAASKSLIFIPLFIVPLVFGRQISEFVRRRLTYPRIGYVKLREEPAGKAIGGVFLYEFVILMVSAVFIWIRYGDVMEFRLWASWSSLIIGVLLLGLFLYLHDKSGKKRYLAIGGLSVLTGLVFSVISFDITFPYIFGYFGPGVVLYFLLMGTVMLLSGIIQLISFVSRNPVSAEDRD